MHMSERETSVGREIDMGVLHYWVVHIGTILPLKERHDR